jgi:hypothetical protein
MDQEDLREVAQEVLTEAAQDDLTEVAQDDLTEVAQEDGKMEQEAVQGKIEVDDDSDAKTENLI